MGDKSALHDGEATEEWTLTFHGTTYIVCLVHSEVLLTVEVEDEEHGDRWSAEFTSQYIEEITQKAGNFKKFSLFTKMLISAFAKSNDSVFVDLLTFADLEVLKARKTGVQSSSSSLRSSESTQKRYIILTYTGEFDRVHYPLPLNYETVPNPVALSRTIRRLRAQLKASKNPEPSTEREKELRSLLQAVRQENTELRHRLRYQRAEGPESSFHGVNSSGSSGNAPPSPARSQPHEQALKRMRKQVEDLTKQLLSTTQELEALKRESRKEIARYQHLALGGSAPPRATPSSRKGVDELKQRVLKLEQELKLERMSHGLPSSSASRGGSRTPTPTRRAAASSTSVASPNRSLYAPTQSSASRQRPGSRSTSTAATHTRTPSHPSSRASSRSASPAFQSRRYDSPRSQQSSVSSRHSRSPPQPPTARSAPAPTLASSRGGHPPSKSHKVADRTERSPSRMRGQKHPLPPPEPEPPRTDSRRRPRSSSRERHSSHGHSALLDDYNAKPHKVRSKNSAAAFVSEGGSGREDDVEGGKSRDSKPRHKASKKKERGVSDIGIAASATAKHVAAATPVLSISQQLLRALDETDSPDLGEEAGGDSRRREEKALPPPPPPLPSASEPVPSSAAVASGTLSSVRVTSTSTSTQHTESTVLRTSAESKAAPGLALKSWLPPKAAPGSVSAAMSSSGLSNPLRRSQEKPLSSTLSAPAEDPEDLSAIDQRINALSQYLENARKGLGVATMK